MQQKHRHWLADNIAAANHSAFLPLWGNARAVQKLHHARRRAGQKVIIPNHNTPHIGGMERIHILLRSNGLDDLLFFQMLWQRELAENAADILPLIELVHERHQLQLRRICRERELLRTDAHLRAGLFLIVDINAGGRVVAHDNHREARNNALFPQCRHLARHARAHLRGNGLAINPDCHLHAPPVPLVSPDLPHPQALAPAFPPEG